MTLRSRNYIFMASVVFYILISSLLSSTADAQFSRLFGKRKPSLPTVFNRMPTQTELLQHLVSIQSKFRQVSSSVVVSLDGTPKLRGSMQLELPMRLRIKAGVMGVSQFGVDVGSNEQDFWVWTKVNLPNQKPAIFYASHEGFKDAESRIRKAIPLEPVWLIEGLGLVQLDRSDVHQLDQNYTPEGFIRLVTTSKTPEGPNYRVTLIHPQYGTVMQQALYDSSLQRLAYTDSVDYKWFPDQGVAMPEKIVMHLFQNGQEATMTILASDYQFDSLYGDPVQMWSLPQPKGIPAIDMTKM